MPSRFRTARPPSFPTMPAVSGETTPSIAEASSGSSNRYGPSIHVTSMSSGSRVRLEGTIAMSSNPNARRPFLPRPISTSICEILGSRADEPSNLAPAPTRLWPGLSELELGRSERLHADVVDEPFDLAQVDHAG